MNTFTFNGVSSATYGIAVSAQHVFNAPIRDLTEIQVPGRNGSLFVDNNRLNNVIVQYECNVVDSAMANVNSIRQWLLGKILPSAANFNYNNTLYDDYDPTHVRIAHFIGGTEFEFTQLNRQATFTIEFSCSPERFVKNHFFTPTTFITSGASMSVTAGVTEPCYPMFEVFFSDSTGTPRMIIETQNTDYPQEETYYTIKFDEIPEPPDSTYTNPLIRVDSQNQQVFTYQFYGGGSSGYKIWVPYNNHTTVLGGFPVIKNRIAITFEAPINKIYCYLRDFVL